MKLIDKLEAMINVNIERDGIHTHKDCNIISVLQELIDEERTKQKKYNINSKDYKVGYNTGYITAKRKFKRLNNED